MSLEDKLSGWTGPSSDTEQEKQERTERMIREAVKVEQQAVLNAVAVALMGLIIAFMTGDGQVAGIAGLIKAVIALGIGFGLHLSDAQQSTFMSFVIFISTMFIRTQVTAPTGVRTP